MLTRRALLPRLLAFGAATGGLVAAVRAERSRMAPDFVGIERWLNTDSPLAMADLRGKVVLVDFWTYSCINCRRTVPYLNRLQAGYGRAGLQVVGIHTPEFSFERMHRNVEASVREFGIRFPVGQDNTSQTWRTWSNRAWPAFYLIDRTGRIVLVREGEGHAAEIEQAIRALLGAQTSRIVQPADDPDLSRIGSPEIYFGAAHPTAQDATQLPRRGEATYAFESIAPPRLNEYQLEGVWLREDEALVLRSGHGRFRTAFSAAKIHLVAACPERAAVTVSVDGGEPRSFLIERPTLYTLLDGDSYGTHRLELEAGAPGLALYSATFG